MSAYWLFFGQTTTNDPVSTIRGILETFGPKGILVGLFVVLIVGMRFTGGSSSTKRRPRPEDVSVRNKSNTTREKQSSRPQFSKNDLYEADPAEFEQLVAEALTAEGYDTEVTPEGPDDGVDVIGKKGNKTVMVQAKRYQPGNKVGSPTVRRVAGSAIHENVDGVGIATSSSFTEPAKETAEEMGVQMIDGDQLVRLLNQ